MLSEYEQNLIKETESPGSNRRRKWSFLRQTSGLDGSPAREMPTFPSRLRLGRLTGGNPASAGGEEDSNKKRCITTIDEVST